MEKKVYVWILTNSKKEFVKVCADCEAALLEMAEWRQNLIKIGLFSSVSKLGVVYFDVITFSVVDREGNVMNMYARRTPLTY